MRSFSKMKQEKLELLLGADKLDCPDTPALNLNRSSVIKSRLESTVGSETDNFTNRDPNGIRRFSQIGGLSGQS